MQIGSDWERILLFQIRATDLRFTHTCVGGWQGWVSMTTCDCTTL